MLSIFIYIFVQHSLPSGKELIGLLQELYVSDVFWENEFIWIKKGDWAAERQISL